MNKQKSLPWRANVLVQGDIDCWGMLAITCYKKSRIEQGVRIAEGGGLIQEKNVYCYLQKNCSGNMQNLHRWVGWGREDLGNLSVPQLPR